MRKFSLLGLAVLLIVGTTTAQTGSFKTFGKGCPGTGGTPGISSSGVPTIGDKFSFFAKTGAPNGQAVLIIGATNTDYKGLKLPYALDKLGAPGCTLYVGLSVMVPTKLDASGLGTNTYAIASDKTLIGLQLFCQYYVRDLKANALGLVTTDAAQAVIGN